MTKPKIILVGISLWLGLTIGAGFARDNGTWDSQPGEVQAWFAGLTQPDNPRLSCCGEADAYWADQIEVKGDQVIAVITDERTVPGRIEVPVGTRIVVPPHKLKWDKGNPTGHTIIFLSRTQDVYCYVQNGGV